LYPWAQKEFNKTYRFFESLKAGLLETARCRACGQVQWPPRSTCAKCLSEDLEWVELPKEGTLESFHQSHVSSVEGERTPFLVGTIRLPNGVRMLAKITGGTVEHLRTGMRMKRRSAGLRRGQVRWTFSPMKQETQRSPQKP